MKAVVVVVALSMLSGTAVAGQSEPAQVKKERKICKREVVTQSRVGGQRICKTAAEWNPGTVVDDGADDVAVMDKSYKAQTGNGAPF